MFRHYISTLVLLLFYSTVGAQTTLPEIPQGLSTVEERASYLIEHYWDSLILPYSKPDFEQSFVDYLDLLDKFSSSPCDDVSFLLDRIVQDGESATSFLDVSEKYLLNPDSAFMDHDLFVHILDVVGSKHGLAPRQVFFRDALSLNRPGTTANDLDFILRDGREMSLSDICTEYILLFFNSPSCRDCRRMKASLASSPIIKRMVQDGRMTVIAICDIEDFPNWVAESYPSSMLSGYVPDGNLLNGSAYYVLKKPSLYLLGPQMSVISRNISEEKLESVLNGMQ